MITPTEIDYIKEIASLVDIISQDTTLDISARSYGGTLKGPCPWCGGEDRFHVHPQDGNWWCRQCEHKGTGVISYWMQRHNTDFVTACKLLKAACDFNQAECTPPVRWVNSVLAAFVLSWPPSAWVGGVILWADNGTRPVKFDTPADLQRAILEH